MNGRGPRRRRKSPRRAWLLLLAAAVLLPFRARGLGEADFEVRTILRSEFPPARSVLHPAAAQRPRIISYSAATPAERPLWDRLAFRLSGNRIIPSRVDRGEERRFGVQMDRSLASGRLDVEAQIAAREGRTYFPRWGVKVETFGGWRIRFGDVAVPTGGPACRGLGGRGVGIERTLHAVPGASTFQLGVFAARAPVQYANIIQGQLPRGLVAGHLDADFARRSHIAIQTFALSDDRSASDSDRPIRAGGGTGIAASVLKDWADLSGELHRSHIRLDGGERRIGVDGRIAGRVRAGPIRAGGSIEASRGIAYRAGPLGSLQQAPRSVANADLTATLWRGWTAGGWGGIWRQIPVSPQTDEDGLEAPLPEPSGLAVRGRSIGGRVSGTIPGVGTGITYSLERRWRTRTDRSQETDSHQLSIQRPLAGHARLLLQANRLEERGRASRNHVTGSLSVTLPSGAAIAIQQQTVWQEPLGPQLVSIAEISSIRCLQGRLTLGARATQVHQESGDRYHSVQSQGLLLSRIALGRGIDLSVQCRLSRSGKDRVEAVEIGLAHRLDRRGDPRVGLDSEPRAGRRQMLGGIVFEDENGDGIRQPGERGIPGVAVVVDNDVRGPIGCDLDGRYRCLVPEGRHRIRLLPESIPVHYALDGTGTIELDILADLPGGHDFPLRRRTGRIEGRVVLREQDLPVSPNRGEERGAVARIRLILDNGDFTYTDAVGRFAFARLPAGDHEIRLDPSSLPFGYRVEGGEARRISILAGGPEAVRCDFRIHRPVARTIFPSAAASPPAESRPSR